MIETIKKFWVEALCGAVLTGLGFSVRFLWSKVKREHTEQEKIKEGLMAILHDRLFQSCKHFICKGDISVDELKNIEYLYNGYAGLDGNGTGTELYNRVRGLPIR